MGRDVFNILYNIHYFLIVIICIIGIIFIKKYGQQNDAMKFFIWYPSIAIILMFIYAIFNYKLIEIKNRFQILSLITYLSVLAHFIIVGRFIVLQIDNKPSRSLISLIHLIFIGIIFLMFFLVSSFNNLNTLQIFISSLCLFIFCIIYFFKILKNQTKELGNIRISPEFWIISGVFFSMGMLIPIPIVVNMLRQSSTQDLIRVLSIINCSCYIILHLFFLKAYLCLKMGRME
jgi:hypothetical protein